jgi:hypothetical protein
MGKSLNRLVPSPNNFKSFSTTCVFATKLNGKLKEIVSFNYLENFKKENPD